MNPSFALTVPGGNIESYIQSLQAIPLLSAEEERCLAKKLKDANDLDAGRHLVMSHLRFVVHIANTYRGYGLPQADLIQEGNIGLMKAVKRFDPTVGVRLVSFAVHWIRAEIHEYILRNWRIVKVATTKSQRKLFFNLRSAKKCCGWLSNEEAHQVAKDLGVNVKDVFEMESRLNNQDTSFDGPVTESEDESDNFNPVDYVEDCRLNPEEELEQSEWEKYGLRRLHTAIKQLDQRSQEVIKQRWLNEEKTTLHELADQYKVSAERIRQIEQNALLKMKKNLGSLKTS